METNDLNIGSLFNIIHTQSTNTVHKTYIWINITKTNRKYIYIYYLAILAYSPFYDSDVTKCLTT